jgi:iron complex transport system permease protein
VLLLLPLVVGLVALFWGRKALAPGQVWAALVGGELADNLRAVVLRVRLPRVVAAGLVGASLATAGAIFQGTFRNPLVDGRILGISPGAASGVALSLLAGLPEGALAGPAFAGGLTAALLVSLLGGALGGGVLVLVLSGVVVNSFFTSLVGITKYLADPHEILPAITHWLLGEVGRVRWAQVVPLAMACGPALLLALAFRWQFNLLTLADPEASSLGLSPRRARFLSLALGTWLTAAAVSLSGVVGWVGLVVPHAARALVGPDHARLIPATLGLGAAMLILLDGLAHTLLPFELPLGVMTGLVGGPAFVGLLLRRWRTEGGWR